MSVHVVILARCCEVMIKKCLSLRSVIGLALYAGCNGGRPQTIQTLFFLLHFEALHSEWSTTPSCEIEGAEVLLCAEIWGCSSLLWTSLDMSYVDVCINFFQKYG